MRGLLWVAWRAAHGLLLATTVFDVRVQAQAPAAASGAEQEAQGSAPSTLRVALLRGLVVSPRASNPTASTLAGDIDGALLRDLAAIAGIEQPTVSPIDYAEIQLTVGCSDDSSACLSAIAKTVEVDALVVRRLELSATQARVSLMYFDASASDDPLVVNEQKRADDAAALVDAVPGLVRALFGLPDAVVAAPETEATATAPAASSPAASSPDASAPTSGRPGAPPPEPATPSGSVSLWTWVTVGGGVILLASGLAVGADAQSRFDDWKGGAVETSAQAERANEAFTSIEDQATTANILVAAGAVVLSAGGVLLGLDLAARPDADEPAIAVAPRRDGGMLWLQTKFGGP